MSRNEHKLPSSADFQTRVGVKRADRGTWPDPNRRPPPGYDRQYFPGISDPKDDPSIRDPTSAEFWANYRGDAP